MFEYKNFFFSRYNVQRLLFNAFGKILSLFFETRIPNSFKLKSIFTQDEFKLYAVFGQIKYIILIGFGRIGIYLAYLLWLL